MEVLDIVQSAAFKCGIISSFNPDEMPGDILAAGRTVLTDEILPSINCDRTIDVTVTARTYQPEAGVIRLRSFKQPNENFEIIGYSTYTSDELLNDTIWAAEVGRLRPTWLDEWPANDFDEPRTAAIWGSDCRLVCSRALAGAEQILGVNIDFPPMRVDAVLEEPSRIPYTYVYRDEFERSLANTLPGLFTTEEHADELVVLTNGTNLPKRLILPVPLQIINRDHAHAGTIKAPEKFRRYLIDATAVSLAVIYGMSTLAAMQQQAGLSYNLLKKNRPQELHKASVAEELNDKLHRFNGRRYYGNF